jgi:hypothetical protein
MNLPLRKVLYCLMAGLILFQGLVPVFATADITIRCAGQSASAKPCAHEAYNLATGRSSDLMAMMPCCRDMARAALSSSVCKSKKTCEAISEGRCIVKIVWTSSARQTASLTRSHRHIVVATVLSVSPMVPPVAVLYVPTTCKFSDTGPLLWLSNAILHSSGLRAPPAA